MCDLDKIIELREKCLSNILIKKTYDITFFGFKISIMSEIEFGDKIENYFPKNNASDIIFSKHYLVYAVTSTTLLNDFINICNSSCENEVKKTHKSIDASVEVYKMKQFSLFLDKNNNFGIFEVGNELILLCNDEKSLSINLLRVIREIYYENMEKSGQIMMHCAAVSFDDKGILICGNKGAGKTTSMIRFIESGGMFISNDRVFLKQVDCNKYIMTYFPLPIRIGLGTASSTDKYNIIINYNYFRKQDINNYTYDELMRYANPIKYELTPLEMTKIFNCSYIDSFKLDYVIFPRYNPNIKNCKLISINRVDKFKKLLESCMSPRDEDWPDRWLGISNEDKVQIISNATNLLEDIVDTIPSYTLEFGNTKFTIDDLKFDFNKSYFHE